MIPRIHKAGTSFKFAVEYVTHDPDQRDTNERVAWTHGTDHEIDFYPVVKLFNPYGASTWLLTEIEPDAQDIAWGLCDLGMGFPEFGTVSLQELRSYRGPFGLGIERDRHFQADKPISAYIDLASEHGRIIA